VAVPINHRTLTQFIKRLLSDKEADSDVNNHLLENALTILHYSSTQLAEPNQLIQSYHESDAGRLYAFGVNLSNGVENFPVKSVEKFPVRL
jgi:hypothetical protein